MKEKKITDGNHSGELSTSAVLSSVCLRPCPALFPSPWSSLSILVCQYLQDITMSQWQVSIIAHCKPASQSASQAASRPASQRQTDFGNFTYIYSTWKQMCTGLSALYICSSLEKPIREPYAIRCDNLTWTPERCDIVQTGDRMITDRVRPARGVRRATVRVSAVHSSGCTRPSSHRPPGRRRAPPPTQTTRQCRGRRWRSGARRSCRWGGRWARGSGRGMTGPWATPGSRPSPSGTLHNEDSSTDQHVRAHCAISFNLLKLLCFPFSSSLGFLNQSLLINK